MSKEQEQEYETYKKAHSEFMKSWVMDFTKTQERSTINPDGKISDNERYSSRKVHDMDVIDLCKHWGLSFNEGNILKYLIRKKNQDLSDMEKIADYAKREIEHLIKYE
tara:strand:- start:34 stop:357 length:324 start_codon:yes stop_codon:yes gene_type:complete